MAIKQQRPRISKVVITGPYEAGKTTFIRTISEITVLSTERAVSTPDESTSGRTTVAMDFGRVTAAPDLALYLFGTPGQERFEFMLDILAEGMLGFVVLVDPLRSDAVIETRRVLRRFGDLSDAPYVIALNKLVGDEQQAIDDIRTALRLAPEIPVVVTDARDRDAVKRTIVTLLTAVLARIDTHASTGTGEVG